MLGCDDSVMSGDEASVSEDAVLMNFIDQPCAAMFSDELQ